MTLFVPVGGKRTIFKQIVTSATPVALISVDDRALSYTIESMSVRLKGTDTAFDFSIDNGTTNITIAGDETVGTAKFWKCTDHHPVLNEGDDLIFTAGGTTSMHVVVIALEGSTAIGARA